MHQDCIASIFGGCVKHQVKRSLILNAATPTYASRTPAGAGNTKTYTRSVWIMRTLFGVRQDVITAHPSNLSFIGFNSSDQLVIRLANVDSVSNRLFRDPNGFYHIVVRVDLTQANAADRLTVWVNGELITWASYSVPAQNTDDSWNGAVSHRIGIEGGGSGNPFGGYIAEFHNVDGQALTPSSFGRLDVKTALWMPIKYTGVYGANGFYLPMTGDAGDAPATANEGLKDRSGNGNNFTASGIAAGDFTKSSPTNYRRGSDFRGNYAVLNNLSKSPSATLSNGGLSLASAGTSFARGAKSTFPSESRKIYFEVTVGSTYVTGANSSGTQYPQIGVCNDDATINSDTDSALNSSSAWRYLPTGYKMNGAVGTATAFGDAFTTGDVIGCAFDPLAGHVWFSKNGVWQAGGNPSTGANPAFTGLSKALYPCVIISNITATPVAINFGQKGFSYAAPTGFYPLVVSAMPKASIVKPSTAFVQKVDTAANISTALAALRSAWGSSYIDIIKRYDGVEGWRWRFGDDPTNYLDSSTATGGKAAFPALSGNYWGASIRVGAAYGVITGEIAHVNGAATTITDNLGTTRKVVILRRVDAGGDWPVSHPFLSSGKLLWLNKQDGETTASDITNVTANTSQIGAGMASGNYRYIVLSEKSGLINLGREKGAGSTDGTVSNTDLTPALHIKKKINSASNSSWVNWNSARNERNPRTSVFYLDLNNLEDSTNRELDFLANGTKARNVNSVYGGAGDDYVTITIGAFAFATGDCAAQATAR